ncbi:MAG: MmcQ/YjbR family DNA-binding protein [Ignavibacteriaceae bacterium]|nr:MmcQ/YjbR family DNA-binding protein [Ignavibacteriaceae bacterium]
MDIESIRNYCLQKNDVTEELPFDEVSPVYKVCGKIFVIVSLTPPYSINLKCDPEKAIELREKYDAVTPGYHMNKTHWNTVELGSNIPSKLIREWIDHSYELVVNGLNRKTKKKASAVIRKKTFVKKINKKKGN